MAKRCTNKSQYSPVNPSRTPSPGSAALMLRFHASKVTPARLTSKPYIKSSSNLALSSLQYSLSPLLKLLFSPRHFAHTATQDTLSPLAIHQPTVMLPSRYRATFAFLVLLTLILTYLPMPVSSLPIVTFQDRNSHASNSSYINDQLVFDVSFAFGKPRNCATTDKVFDLTSFQSYSSHC